MMTSEGAFQANFPVPSLTPLGTLTEQPTYLTIEMAQKKLNANAISVHSYDGGGLNRHLTLTVTPAAYLVIAGVNYMPPVATSAEPVLIRMALRSVLFCTEVLVCVSLI